MSSALWIIVSDYRLPERIHSNIEVDPETGCWLWQGATTGGYGRIYWERKHHSTHRLVYELLVGPIEHTIDHVKERCSHKHCCNPEHLEDVTLGENIRRGPQGALQAAKTHCPQGHHYSPENTYRNPQGSRECRECGRAAVRRYRSKDAVRV